MSDFIYGDCFYLNAIDKKSKRSHEILIQNNSLDINIIPPNFILRKSLIKTPTMYYEKMIIPWMQKNLHIVTKLSRIDVWNKKVSKRKKCVWKEMVLEMFWIIVIIQDFAMLLLNFMN